jgi:hypothetical protein
VPSRSRSSRLFTSAQPVRRRIAVYSTLVRAGLTFDFLIRARHHALDRLTPSFALEIPQVHPAGQSRKLSFSVAQVLTDPCALPVARRGRVRVRSARLGEAPRAARGKTKPRAETGRSVGVGNPARGTLERSRGTGGAQGECVNCVGGTVLSDDEVLFLLLVVEGQKVSAGPRLFPLCS